MAEHPNVALVRRGFAAFNSADIADSVGAHRAGRRSAHAGEQPVQR